MNIPKYQGYKQSERLQFTIGTCASDNHCTCDTCNYSVEKCKEEIDITAWLDRNE